MTHGTAGWLLAAAVAGLLGAVPVRAAEGDSSSIHLGGDQFTAGGHVRVDEPISGDGFLAGHEVDVSSSVGGDLIAAATEVRLHGRVGHNLYAAGRRVDLDGNVDGNARLAASDLHVAPGARIGGGATLAAQTVEFEGQALGYLAAAANTVSIDGHVSGDVTVAAADLEVGPQAIIGGSLVFRGPRPANVASTARIAGGMRFIPQRERHISAQPAFFSVGAWLWLVGWMIVGVLMVTIWPAFTSTITAEASRRYLYAALVGLVVLIVTPVAIALLLVTVIGIPLALVLLALYLLEVPLGYLAGTATIADALAARVPALAASSGRRALALAIALLVLFLVKRIPYLGPVIVFVVLIAGMGGLLLAARQRHGAAALAARDPRG